MDLTYAVIEVSPGGVVSWLVMGLIAGWIAGVAMKCAALVAASAISSWG